MKCTLNQVSWDFYRIGDPDPPEWFTNEPNRIWKDPPEWFTKKDGTKLNLNEEWWVVQGDPDDDGSVTAYCKGDYIIRIPTLSFAQKYYYYGLDESAFKLYFTIIQ